MEKESSVVALAWKILYDEELEHIPDPNKPENVPYLKAVSYTHLTLPTSDLV